jgi:hypothetical protein
MKKILFVVCSLLTTSLSFGQRNADLSITMTSPDSAINIQGTETFTFNATLTNNGPDPIKTTDTLVLAFILDNASSPDTMVVQGQTVTEVGLTVSSTMASGTSATISQPVAFATSPSLGVHNLCALAIVLNRSADSVKDSVTANNKSCSEITIVSPSAVKTIVNNQLLRSIYPNPARQTANVDINLTESSNVLLNVTDLVGRTVYSRDYGYISAGKNTLSIDLHNISAGNYIVNIKAGNSYNHERITVQP